MVSEFASCVAAVWFVRVELDGVVNSSLQVVLGRFPGTTWNHLHRHWSSKGSCWMLSSTHVSVRDVEFLTSLPRDSQFVSFHPATARVGSVAARLGRAVFPDRRSWFVLLATAVFFFLSFVFRVYVVFCFIVSGCQYQCSWLPGKTRLWDDRLFVEWDVKPYSLTHWSDCFAFIVSVCIRNSV